MVDKQKPRWKCRVGNISISQWRNKIKSDKGDFEVDTISIQRSYKKSNDEKAEWINETLNCRKNDIIKLKVAIDEVAKQLFLNQDDKEEKEA